MQVKRFYVVLETPWNRDVDFAVRVDALDTTLAFTLLNGQTFAEVTVSPIIIAAGSVLSLRYQAIGGNANKANGVMYIDQLSD
jgi:hypothetical protein